MRHLAEASQANLARRDGGTQHLSVWKWMFRSFPVGYLQNILASFIPSHTMFHLSPHGLCEWCACFPPEVSPPTLQASAQVPRDSSYPHFCRPQLLTLSQKCRGILSAHESLPVTCVSISTMCGWGVRRLKVGEGTLSDIHMSGGYVFKRFFFITYFFYFYFLFVFVF